MRRLRRVVLENFQSHRYTELVLAPTMTVLIGESDQGKSAVVRALRWLLYNKPQGADFMRVGADYCRVAAEFDDGLVIIRERRGKTNRYEIRRSGQEPQVLEGFGREVPAEVEELTDVRPLRLEGTSFELHVAHQLDPPFLLKETPATRARAVGHLSGTQLFDAAEKRAGRKLVTLARKRQDLEERLARLSVELKRFADLKDIEERFDRCAGFFQRSEQASVSAGQLATLREKFQRVAGELRRNKNLLTSLPQTSDLQAGYEAAVRQVLIWRKIWDLRERGSRVSTLLAEVQKMLTATAAVKEADEMAAGAAANLERLKTLTRANLRRTALKREERKLAGVLACLQTVPVAGELFGQLHGRVSALVALETFHTRRQECLHRFQREETTFRQLDGVTAAGEMWKIAEFKARRLAVLKELHRRYRAALRELPSVGKRLEEAQGNLGRLAADLRDLLLKTSRCPVCLTALSTAQVETILENELGEVKDGRF